MNGRSFNLTSHALDFITKVNVDINDFFKHVAHGGNPNRVLIFPLFDNHHRFLVHKVVEDFLELRSFSLGASDRRRLVVCRKTIMRELSNNVSVVNQKRWYNSRTDRWETMDDHIAVGSRRCDEHEDRSALINRLPPTDPPSRTDCASWRYLPAKHGSNDKITAGKKKARKPEVQIYVPPGRSRNQLTTSSDPETTDTGVGCSTGLRQTGSIPASRTTESSIIVSSQNRRPKSQSETIRLRTRDSAEACLAHQSRLEHGQMMYQITNDNDNRSLPEKNVATRKSLQKKMGGKESKISDIGEISQKTDMTRVVSPKHLSEETAQLSIIQKSTLITTIDTKGCTPGVSVTEGVKYSTNGEEEPNNIQRKRQMNEYDRASYVNNLQNEQTGEIESWARENVENFEGCTKASSIIESEQVPSLPLGKCAKHFPIEEIDSRCVNDAYSGSHVSDQFYPNYNNELNEFLTNSPRKMDGVILPYDLPECDMETVTKKISYAEVSDFGDAHCHHDLGEMGREVSWDALYTEDGDCLNPEMFERLTSAVGQVEVFKPAKDYLKFSPKDPEINHAEMGHLVEIADFPKDFLTRDLLNVFSDFMSRGFDVKWVDDNHAIGIFSSELVAQEALKMRHPLLSVRRLSEATRQTKLKAKQSADLLQPYRARPETSVSAARRLVSGALGIGLNVSKQDRDEERRKLREARDRKKKAAADREAAWDGTLESDLFW